MLRLRGVERAAVPRKLLESAPNGTTCTSCVAIDPIHLFAANHSGPSQWFIHQRCPRAPRNAVEERRHLFALVQANQPPHPSSHNPLWFQLMLLTEAVEWRGRVHSTTAESPASVGQGGVVPPSMSSSSGGRMDPTKPGSCAVITLRASARRPSDGKLSSSGRPPCHRRAWPTGR